MWRFKSDMFGRPVHVGQTVTAVGGVQAQVQELGINGTPTISGVISERTHFVFRSRSARIIWLVQISCEMWEYDQNGDLYFEKFLNQFADPLFDRWKALGVTHSLTVVFFGRTLYLDGVDPTLTPDLCCKASLQKRSDGVLYQDFFKVVLENSAEVDKVAHLRILKKEFWAFPQNVGWNIGRNKPYGQATGTYTIPKIDKIRPIAVPSDALTGNVLEAINTTLNLLDKHYIDRDLVRTGNSIVMISAGVGMFKVKPTIALISKQRMMDTGIGLDFISLSQPPLHFVPLFLFDCKEEGLGDFYVVPQWINVCYVDCRKDSSATVENATGTATAKTPGKNTGKNSGNSDLNSIGNSNGNSGGITGGTNSYFDDNVRSLVPNYHWTGLEEYGGIKSIKLNKDKEVEKLYHNIHNSSNNGNNNGNEKNTNLKSGITDPGSYTGDDFIWGEGFTPQPFSSILQGHLYGKSGIELPFTIISNHLLSIAERKDENKIENRNENKIEYKLENKSDDYISGSVTESMKINSFRDRRNYEEKYGNGNDFNGYKNNGNGNGNGNNNGNNFDSLCVGNICISDVQRNKSLVHAFALPAPLKWTLENENFIKYPGKNLSEDPVKLPYKNKIEEAIEIFALNVKNNWAESDPESTPIIEINENIENNKNIQNIENINNDVEGVEGNPKGDGDGVHEIYPTQPTHASQIPQWGYFSFQDASAAIIKMSENTGNIEGNSRKKENLDYENDTHEFNLLRERSVSFSDDDYYTDGLKNSFSTHSRGQSFFHHHQNNINSHNAYKRELLKREREAGKVTDSDRDSNRDSGKDRKMDHDERNRDRNSDREGERDRDRNSDRDRDRGSESSFSMVSFMPPHSSDPPQRGKYLCTCLAND